MAEEIEIAKIDGDWSLFTIGYPFIGGWMPFVLRKMWRGRPRRKPGKRNPKVAFYLKHNGARTARGHDAKILAEKYPGLHPAVSAAATRHIAENILRQ